MYIDVSKCKNDKRKKEKNKKEVISCIKSLVHIPACTYVFQM
jgi:hypothetical protein